MKKMLTFQLMLMMVFTLSFAIAEDEPTVYTSGKYGYILLEDGTAEITDFYSGMTRNIAIPAEIDRHRVSSIGSNAFHSASLLESVSIPNSVTVIRENPFRGCSYLTTISISPDHPTLSVIDDVLFDKNTKALICYPGGKHAKSYAIPQGIHSIGDYAFYSCDSLTSISIPNSVTSIGGYAFYCCESLASVAIPNSVTSIGSHAFYFCESLVSVAIPDNVTFIGDDAFSYCRSLVSVSIPNSVTTIIGNPFSGCCKLIYISVSPDHPLFATIDGVLFEKNTQTLVCYPGGNPAQSYVIPQGTRIIGHSAFEYCNALTTVSISDNVTLIEDYAFYDCESLISVSIPNSITSIGKSAFDYCSSLHSITIPSTITNISDEAFSECTSLTYVSMPDSIITIGKRAFYGCQSLTSVTIPGNVTSIGDLAFYGCQSLTSITIPVSVTSIGERAFSSCNNELIFTVDRNSYAAQWCEDNNKYYTYPNALDWLLN